MVIVSDSLKTLHKVIVLDSLRTIHMENLIANLSVATAQQSQHKVDALSTLPKSPNNAKLGVGPH